MRKLALMFVVIFGVLIAGCEEAQPSAQQKEQAAQNRSNETLVNDQPAQAMNYSPTRDAAIQWAKTWEQEGKIAYVYFRNEEAVPTGYYVLKGLPVSYNASLTPTHKADTNSYGRLLIPNPAMDGMYYGAGTDSRYYGFDAISGAYLEWSANGGQEFFISDQPINAPEATPLGDATVEAVQNQE